MWGRPRKGAGLERFVRYEVAELGHSPETGLTYERMLRSGARRLGKEVWEVTVADCRALMVRGDLSWRWKSSFVSAIKAYRRWGVVEGLWEMDGYAALRPPKRKFKEDKAPVSDETARRLIEAARGSYETRIVRLPLFGGLRLLESTLVDSWTDRMKVHGKGAKLRYVPVHPMIEEVKGLILEKQPPSKASLRTAFIRVRDRVGAKDIDGKPATPHSLRHTFSTHLTEKRVPGDYIDEAMGHERGTRGIYSKIPWMFVVETVLVVDYFTGEPVQLSLL